MSAIARNAVTPLPVAIIGAGPTGLAAAAHLAERQIPFIVLEASSQAGAAIRRWSHVRMFSPWRYLIDRAGARLLSQSDWPEPDLDRLPTGGEFVETYLQPLAEHQALRPHIRYGAKVVSVGRDGFDKVKSQGREVRPFEIRLSGGARLQARAVIDASGTWFQPNPIGSGGLPAQGEPEAQGAIEYGIPDIKGAAKERYAGKRVLVVGSGHSAMNALLDLLKLADSDAAVSIHWALRRETLDQVYGGGGEDALPARGALGARVRQAVADGRLEVITPWRIESVLKSDDGLLVSGRRRGETHALSVDEIIAATGFRPDLDMLREVRLDLDPWLEAPRTLAPMIDPNVHSCGTVRPHGAVELAHPEKDFFILGMKSYGRAPTFLMATGYEQARSVAAMLAGDIEAARRVELMLPETGVCGGAAATAIAEPDACCSTEAGAEQSVPTEAIKEIQTMAELAEEKAETAGCCGGPAPQGVDACCVKDADAKAAGEDGCGCQKDTAPAPEKAEVAPAAACCG